MTYMRALPWQRFARWAMLAGAAVALCSCATAPAPGSATAERSPKLANMGVRDMRAEFRHAFCARLSSKLDCTGILRRLPGEPVRATTARNSTITETSATLAGQYRLAFVPGLLAGCAGSTIMPFADTKETLRATGFDARILSIEGRGSTEHNADLIARQIIGADPDPRPWIVFGYSKGLPDVLEALIRHPEISGSIAAVVSYAGAVGGSPLADDSDNLPAALLEHVPMPGCDRGDGSSIASLRRDVRHAWWQAHHTKLRLPFYSLVATARADRVSRPLQGSYATLSQTDTLNDGQLIAADAVVPGSALLGYVNADHWAIAMPLSEQLPVISGMFVDDVPRADLVLAAVQVISRHTARSHGQADRP